MDSRRPACLALVLVLAACPRPEPEPELRDLAGYPNRFVDDLYYEAQPDRARPRALALSVAEDRLFVALEGSVDEPGRTVVGIDLERRIVDQRFAVGSNPTGLAVHPGGRVLVAANRLSNHLSMIDLVEGTVRPIVADFYFERLAFSNDGKRLFATNRQHDQLVAFDVRQDGKTLHLDRASNDRPIGVGANPHHVIVSDDDDTVWVTSMMALSVATVGAKPLKLRDTLNVGAPVNDFVVHGDFAYAATTSSSTHHPALEGPDTNGDGVPGDGTPNQGFQDLQNELAVYALPDLSPVVRYTSDTICCFDYRDVSPDDPELGHLMPDPALWIVGGALPEALAVDGDTLLVVYSGSNEVQRFDIAADGTLSGGPKVHTQLNPSEIVVSAARREAYISNRLSDTISVLDLDAFEVVATIDVGPEGAPTYPATDAELGELFFFSGADFSVDGDQTCNHCHRERGNIAKAFSMPLLADPRGTRMNPASRGMFETRPWFFEGAMDENNFFPVINEFARSENFCCADFPDLIDCPVSPPVECAERPYPRNVPTRDRFFLDAAQMLLGRAESFGGALSTRIDYLGLTRLLGLFLLHEPGLMPNPYSADTPDVQRGRRVFDSPSTACRTCHPPPGFAVSFDAPPNSAPTHFGPVITPTRAADGSNLDLTNPGFLQTFPMAEQADGDVRFNPPTLVGIWDRAPMFLHDGRAASLREALCTPGHPALADGETGFNEADGVIDSHGGTSHLSAGEIADLIAYLTTL